MSCPAFSTGEQFLSGVITHIDCQAATLGSSGFAALADPASGSIAVLTALLTLFIAIFGIRMMLGREIDGLDLIGSAIKVGIVLTLALSWPAWRIVGYDVVMNGPQEIAGALGRASGLPTGEDQFLARLQNLDDGMVAMTMAGSGRLTGGVSAGADLGDSPRGIALADQTGLGFGRIAFLVGTLAPLATVRLAGGLLIALAPLMAGLLLFAGTNGVFFGWLRALAAAALGNLLLVMVYGTELSAIEPWLRDVLMRRAADVLTPSAPGELLVMTLAFALVAFGVLALASRIAFFGPGALPAIRLAPRADDWPRPSAALDPAAPLPAGANGQAARLSESVARTIARETRLAASEDSNAPSRLPASLAANPAGAPERAERLGASWRSPARRTSAAARQRDIRA